MIRIRRSLALAAALVPAALGTAFGQGFDLATGGGRAPIEVVADQGIEWQQNEKVFVARGNAVAKRGDVTVSADALRAWYRERADGNTEIWRLTAEGKVRIVSPDMTAQGDRAVYDIDDAVLVITGENLRLTTPRDVVTARDSLEYWERKQMAVARGKAVAARENRTIRADILSAHFTQAAQSAAVRPSSKPSPQTATGAAKVGSGGASGETVLQRIDAYDNVTIVTATETVTADRGAYDAQSGLATLTGSVKINRGQNQLRGARAVVDLNTGISRLLSGSDGDGRVRGLFVPQDGKEQPSATPKR